MEEEASPFTREIEVNVPQSQKFKPLPVKNEKDKFVKEVVPVLEEVKDNPEAKQIAKDHGIYVGNSGWHNFLAVFFVITLIIFFAGILYLAYNDHFKTDVFQSLSCPPVNISIPECPKCADITCPQQICNLSCPPSQINLYNGTFINSS